MQYITSVLINLLVLFITVHCDKKPLYHELSKKVFEAGTSLPKDALFGYSIAYQLRRGKIIISAPRADFQGQVFECNIEAHNACSKLKIDLQKSIRPGATQADLKWITPFWLGASIGAGSDFFMTCAPHYSNYAVKEKRYLTTSRCFYQSATGIVHGSKVLKDQEKIESNMLFYNNTKMANVWEKRFDTIGWSIDVSRDDTTIVGGPGAAMGRAMIIPKRKTEDPQLIDLTRNYSDPDGVVLYNFGYSVKAGKFLGSEGYAVSSPYGTMGKGKVLLYSKSLKYIQAIVDDEVGSIFGGALCSARLGEGVDEALLVGAPASTRRDRAETDVGAVHVYLNEAKIMRRKRTIRGYHNYGYFGSAIASVGDLNLDGQDEVVISAPFENEYRGAVYIYSGADLLKEVTSDVQWLQRIEGDAPGQMLGLGLSPIQDLDDNGCKELSIGLPGNNRALLMKCMAFVTFSLDLKESKGRDEITRNSPSVFMNMCVKIAFYEKLKNILNNVTVIIKLNHPNATLADSENNVLTYDIPISNEKNECRPLEIKMSLNGDYEKEMVLQVNASLSGQDPSNLTEYKYGLVMLTDDTQTYLEKKISVPGSKLEMNPSTSFSNATGYLIGSTKSENLTIEVSNAPSSRGGAYGACVRGRIRGAKVTHTPTNCALARADAGYTYTCEPSEPIFAGKTMISTLTLDTESLTDEVDSIEIEAQLFKLCGDTRYLINKTMSISLQKDVNITVAGESIPSAVVNVSEAEIAFGYEDIRHIYSIINTGVTSCGRIICTVSIPQHVRYSISTDSQGAECRRDHSKGIVTCVVNKLVKNIKRNINILMDILPNTPFTEKVHRGKVELETELSCMIAGEKRIKRITTTMHLLHTSVPLWIIVVSIGIGLLILLIVTFVLYECGFMRRKHKEELIALISDIHRQSVRRSLRQSITGKSEEPLELNNEADDACFVSTDPSEPLFDQPRHRRVTADIH